MILPWCDESIVQRSQRSYRAAHPAALHSKRAGGGAGPGGIRVMAVRLSRYASVTSNTQRVLPLSFDSLRDAWTGLPKMASKLSFW